MSALLKKLFKILPVLFLFLIILLITQMLHTPLAFGDTTQTITVSPIIIPDAIAGQGYSLTFTASGGTPPYVFTMFGLPSGMSFNNGLFYGTIDYAGGYGLTLDVKDSKNISIAQNYSFNVEAPYIEIYPSSLGLPDATVNKSYNQSFYSINGKADYTYSESGSLPSGITFSYNSNGASLSGTPTVTGNFSIIITATDADSYTNSHNYFLNIDPPPITISPSPKDLPDATAENSYKQVFTASGGTPPYTISEKGALPQGLVFGGGTLSGITTASGSFSITLTATDSNNYADSQQYVLDVNSPTLEIVPAAASLPEATVGNYYSQAFATNGGATPYTFRENGTLPFGLAFNNGALSGTPMEHGNYPVTITATDPNNYESSQKYTLIVRQPTNPAVIAPPTFSDVAPSYWAHDAIVLLSKYGYTKGYADGTFKPNNSVTRAEFVSILNNILKPPAYTPQQPDYIGVSSADWFYGAVENVTYAKIIAGYDSGKFEPNRVIDREEMACIMTNILGQQNAAIADMRTPTSFLDDTAISDWARGCLVAAIKDGLIAGYSDNTIRPHGQVSRAEACVVLMNFLNLEK